MSHIIMFHSNYHWCFPYVAATRQEPTLSKSRWWQGCFCLFSFLSKTNTVLNNTYRITGCRWLKQISKGKDILCNNTPASIIRINVAHFCSTKSVFPCCKCSPALQLIIRKNIVWYTLCDLQCESTFIRGLYWY